MVVFFVVFIKSTPCVKKKGEPPMIPEIQTWDEKHMKSSIVDPQGFVDTVIENGKRNGKGLVELRPSSPFIPSGCVSKADQIREKIWKGHVQQWIRLFFIMISWPMFQISCQERCSEALES